MHNYPGLNSTLALMRSLNFSLVFSVILFLRLYNAASSTSIFDFSEIPEFNLKEHEMPFTIVLFGNGEIRSIGTPAPKPDSSVSKPSPVEPETKTAPSQIAISSIRKPTKTSRNISDLSAASITSPSGETNSTPKRKKTYPVHNAGKPIEQIITEEVVASGFKTGPRLAQFRNTLNLISLNNYDLFMEDLNNFKSVFGCNYGSLKKDDAVFLYRYVLLFGAYNIAPALTGNRIIVTEGHLSAFNYLLESKPFIDVITLFFSNRFLDFTEEARDAVQAGLLAHCPENFIFRKSLIYLIGKASFLDDYKRILSAPESQETFDDLAGVIGNHEFLPNGSGILRVIALEKVEYYKNTNQDIKFKILTSCISRDDLEGFTHFLAEDPSMILYTKSDFIVLTGTESFNVVTEAISYKAEKCLDFLISTFPELATTSTGRFDAPVLFLIRRAKLRSLYEIFDKYGVGATQVITIDGKDMNLLQASFYQRSKFGFSYYSSHVGDEITKFMIRSLWTSNEEILEHIFKDIDVEFIQDASTALEIDLNATYKYNNYEGNAIIFVDFSNYPNRRFFRPEEVGIDNSAPIYHNNPRTGERRLSVLPSGIQIKFS